MRDGGCSRTKVRRCSVVIVCSLESVLLLLIVALADRLADSSVVESEGIYGSHRHARHPPKPTPEANNAKTKEKGTSLTAFESGQLKAPLRKPFFQLARTC